MQNQPASPVSPDGPVLSQTDGPAVNQSAGQTPPHLAGNIPSQPPLPPQPPPIQAPKFPNPKRTIIIILIILVLFAAISGYLFYLSQQPKPAAQVGQEKITREQVANFSRDCDIAQNEAVEFLVDNIVLEKWVQDEKIAFSKEDQKAEEIRISGKEAAINCIAVQAKVNLLRERLNQAAVGYREGKFIVVNFDRFGPNPFLLPPEATQGADISELRKKEQEYADRLVQSISEDLRVKKLTFEQALEKVQKDPNVGLESNYASAIQSGPFTATDYIEKRGLLKFEDVREKVDSLKENEFSEPFVQKVNVSLEEDKPQLVDGRWIIAKVDRIGKDEGKADDILVETRQKYGTKIYLK